MVKNSEQLRGKSNTKKSESEYITVTIKKHKKSNDVPNLQCH